MCSSTILHFPRNKPNGHRKTKKQKPSLERLSLYLKPVSEQASFKQLAIRIFLSDSVPKRLVVSFSVFDMGQFVVDDVFDVELELTYGV